MVSLHWYLVMLAALGVERLFEFLRSRRNTAWALSAGGVEVGQGHYRVMVLFHTAFLFSAAAEPLVLGRPFSPLVGWPCLALALGAQGLRYWAISTLGRRWNTRVIVLPDAAPVTQGPYRWSRHPNYLAVIIELAAVPLVHGAFLTALVFSLGNVALLAVRIHVEETALGPLWQAAFEGRARFLPKGRW